MGHSQGISFPRRHHIDVCMAMMIILQHIVEVEGWKQTPIILTVDPNHHSAIGYSLADPERYIQLDYVKDDPPLATAKPSLQCFPPSTAAGQDERAPTDTPTLTASLTGSNDPASFQKSTTSPERLKGRHLL